MAKVPSWLTELIEKADISAVEEDFGPIQEGEEAIGVICENTRAIFAAYAGQKDVLEKLQAEHEKLSQVPGTTQGQLQEIENKFTIENNKRDALSELFWATTKAELNISGCSVAIRDGWQLVKMPKKPRMGGMIILG